MRRAFSDLLLSACAVIVLLGVLVAFDSRVREQASAMISGAGTSQEIAAAQSQAGQLASVVVGVVKEQADQHRPLMIFVVAATVLTLFMVRT